MVRTRTITDPQGHTWLVRSVYPTASTGLTPAGVHPDYRAGWLTFESGDRKRRLAPIPSGWELMPDDSLRALLASATDARRLTPSLAPRVVD